MKHRAGDGQKVGMSIRKMVSSCAISGNRIRADFPLCLGKT
jgi:hypothetical protein